MAVLLQRADLGVDRLRMARLSAFDRAWRDARNAAMEGASILTHNRTNPLLQRVVQLRREMLVLLVVGGNEGNGDDCGRVRRQITGWALAAPPSRSRSRCPRCSHTTEVRADDSGGDDGPASVLQQSLLLLRLATTAKSAVPSVALDVTLHGVCGSAYWTPLPCALACVSQAC